MEFVTTLDWFGIDGAVSFKTEGIFCDYDAFKVDSVLPVFVSLKVSDGNKEFLRGSEEFCMRVSDIGLIVEFKVVVFREIVSLVGEGIERSYNF